LLPASACRFLQTPLASDDGRTSAPDWGVYAQPFGTLLTHNGSNDYWHAVVGVSPDSGNALIVAANAAEDSQADAVTALALREVIREWAPAPPPPP